MYYNSRVLCSPLYSPVLDLFEKDELLPAERVWPESDEELDDGTGEGRILLIEEDHAVDKLLVVDAERGHLVHGHQHLRCRGNVTAVSTPAESHQCLTAT